MRAAVIDRFGPPEVLEMRTVARPVPGPGQVLVEVIAAGLNPVDTQNRSDGSWAQITLPAILGSDAAGIVRAVGSEVTGWAAGDEVFYFSDFLGGAPGTYAQFQVVDATIIARRPATVDFVQSAALPLAAGTAYELIHRRLAVAAGEWLIVHGAGGGVGTYAVQLAVHLGARVIAVAGAGTHDALRELGAELTVDYRTTDVAEAVAAHAGSVDAVADLVGGSVVEESLSVVREGGRVASICALRGDLEAAIDRNLTVHGVLVRPDAGRLRSIARLVDAGALRPIVAGEFTLDELADAHRRLERGHSRGKLVARVRPELRGERRADGGARLDHVGVTVSDLDRSLSFYRDLLGLPLRERGETRGPDLDALLGRAGARVETADLDAGDGRVLELVQYLSGPGPVLEYDGASIAAGHVAIAVDELETVLVGLRDAGVTVISDRPVRFVAPGSAWDGVQCVYVRDPDGAIVELVQRPRSAPGTRAGIG